MKILLVEDDRRASDYLAKGLRELGHVVEQANDGEEGCTPPSPAPTTRSCWIA
jgi:DNA-binding response OmpR family regulator